jgi:transposase
MSPVNILQLTLPGYRTIRTEGNSLVRAYLEVLDTPTRCPYCEASRLRSKGRYERRVRHTDCFEQPSQLIISCRRYRCLNPDCQRTFVQPLPGIMPGRRSSERWRQLIYLQHHDGIAASILGQRERLGPATVARIYAQFTERKAKERMSLDCPMVLGIDEHTLHQGMRFATTFCDLKKHRVFDVAQGRSEAELAPFLRQLRGREKVRVICIDLSNTYRAMIKRWFPNALIVADRFHAVRLAGMHLMRVARQVCPDLGWNRAWLGLLRTRHDRLDADRRQRLKKLLIEKPVLEGIYAIKEKLCRLLCLKMQNASACRQHVPRLLELIDTLKRTPFEAALTLAKALTDWIEEIARMWRFSRNNGITEGFHRKIKLIQRRAYGFRSFTNYRLRVIAQCG